MTARPAHGDPAAALDLLVGMLAERLAEPLAARLGERLGVGPAARSEPKFMSVKEAAQFCRVSEKTIRRLMATGQVRVHRVRRRVLVMRDDVLAALQRDGGTTETETSSEAERVANALLRRVK